MSQHAKPGAQYGRPPKGAFPACPDSGICRAQSVRTHSACRNCAVSNMSLTEYLGRYGTNKEKYQNIMVKHVVCGDLLTRVIESFQGSHGDPNFEKIVLILYAMFGNGNIASRYLGTPLTAPRPQDQAHARMILEAFDLTCYAFNNESVKCMYIEDIIYCKRHTPVLTPWKLSQLCNAYTRKRKRHQKHKQPFSAANDITSIKQSIQTHEKQFQKQSPGFKEIALRKMFNTWLKTLRKE
jgi:hypothetical protein